MKNICLLFTFIIILNVISMAQCPEDLFIWSQEQIDNFQEDYPGCTEIDGMVDITGSEIKNLEGLSVLTSISGSFTIWLADSVESLEGLNNLQFVGGDFSIYEDNRLSDITALENLGYIGGGLYLRYNTQLTNLNGLNNLDSIASDFYLRNSAVTNFEGLESLQKVGADFWIDDNPKLIDFSGLNMLEEIQGEVRVNSNDALINFNGLGNLEIVHGSFTVGGIFNYNMGNPSLLNLKGLEKLVHIDGPVQIESNDALVNLEGLNSLDLIYGNLIIEHNKQLIDLSGLESLTSVFSLGVGFNDTLQTLEGLSTNLDIHYSLVVQSNPYLSTCEVKSVCNHLDLSFEDTFISGNADGCATKEEVEEACEAESIHENQQLFFEIYPNPSADFIIINLQSENDYQYKIFNTLGKLIVKDDSFNTKLINISELSVGTYIIELSNDKKTARRVFIKK